MALTKDGSFFFFQAEDGIRVGHVTGVQTCALPISPTPPCCSRWAGTSRGSGRCGPRSEERRVGKEGRSRGAPEEQKRNNMVQYSRTREQIMASAELHTAAPWHARARCMNRQMAE